MIDIGIAYRDSVDEAYQVMRLVAAEMRVNDKSGSRILDDIDIAGVQEWGESAVTLRCRFKTVALEQRAVRREFLRCMKEAFDAHGIEIPYPHLTPYAGQDKQGNAPAFHLSVSGRDR